MFTLEQLEKLDKNKQDFTQTIKEKRYQYLGILNEYQTVAKDLKQEVIYTKLNPYQHFLFKRVLHGTKIYSKEELNKMHWDKKKRVKKVWERGQREINSWKQILCNKKANTVFKSFKNSKFVKKLLSISINEVDTTYRNQMSFKQLGIKYEDVIFFFIGKGLLPKNFLSVNEKSVKKNVHNSKNVY